MAPALGALETLEMKHVMLGDGLAIVVVVVRPVLVAGVVQVVVYRRVRGRSHHKLVGGYRLVTGGTGSRSE